MKTILVIMFFLFSVKGFAQSTDSIKVNNLSFKWNKWRLNGKRIYKDEVKAEMMKVDEAFMYYEKGRTNLTIGLIAYVPMVTFILLGKQNLNEASPYYGKTRIGFNIVGFLSAGVFFYEFARYSKNSKKAARIYNEY